MVGWVFGCTTTGFEPVQVLAGWETLAQDHLLRGPVPGHRALWPALRRAPVDGPSGGPGAGPAASDGPGGGADAEA